MTTPLFSATPPVIIAGLSTPMRASIDETREAMDSWIPAMISCLFSPRAMSDMTSDSFGQMDIQRIVEKERGIPCLMLEADMVDERIFSESQISTRIDAFMEIIKERKKHSPANETVS